MVQSGAREVRFPCRVAEFALISVTAAAILAFSEGQLMNSAVELPKVLNEYVQGSDHPDLQVYRRDIADGEFLNVWRWRIDQYCALGNFYGKRLLEVGCGFGWDAVGLALIGNNEVVACDILPSMVEGMSQCLDTMRARNKALPITPLQGDICKLDLPS